MELTIDLIVVSVSLPEQTFFVKVTKAILQCNHWHIMCKLMVYRAFNVAVRVFTAFYLIDDKKEASILTKLAHPFLPNLFGICSGRHPFRIITKFHGIKLKPNTLLQELTSLRLFKETRMWLIPTAQLFEAVEYLHENANILQNDIKCDNILLADDTSISASSSSTSALDYHIVLVDFGKAADKESGRRYRLSETEKVTNMTKYPHIAPEVTQSWGMPSNNQT